MSSYFLFVIPPLIFMLYAQFKVSSTFKKYSQVPASSRLTGMEAAQRLLRFNNLDGVRLEGVKGTLSDHYDSQNKVLRLSPDVGNSSSVAALGVVAHEVGHAAQDRTGYSFLRFRNSLVPVANLGTKLGYICIIGGLMLYAALQLDLGLTVAYAGVALFFLAVAFALVTLPVEFNASKRARAMLAESGLVSAGAESSGASAVLSAAALTYVAALLQALGQLFYFLYLVLGARRR